MKRPVPTPLPSGLTVDDMTGRDAQDRRFTFSLYRRGLLSAGTVKAIRRRLEAGPVTPHPPSAPCAFTPGAAAFSATSRKSSKTYFLHIRETPGRTGSAPRRLFYFSGDARNAAPQLPEGYTVGENERTGLPFVKRAQQVNLPGKCGHGAAEDRLFGLTFRSRPQSEDKPL